MRSLKLTECHDNWKVFVNEMPFKLNNMLMKKFHRLCYGIVQQQQHMCAYHVCVCACVFIYQSIGSWAWVYQMRVFLMANCTCVTAICNTNNKRWWNWFKCSEVENRMITCRIYAQILSSSCFTYTLHICRLSRAMFALRIASHRHRNLCFMVNNWQWEP